MSVSYSHLLKLSNYGLRMLVTNLLRNNLVQSHLLLHFIYGRRSRLLLVMLTNPRSFYCSLSNTMYILWIELGNLSSKVLMLNKHSIWLSPNILDLRSLNCLPLPVILLLPIINYGGHLKYLALTIRSSPGAFICLSLIWNLLILLRDYHLGLIHRDVRILRYWLKLLLLCDLLTMCMSSADILWNMWKCYVWSLDVDLLSICSTSLDILVLLLNDLTLGVQELFLSLRLHLTTPYGILERQGLISFFRRLWLGRILKNMLRRLINMIWRINCVMMWLSHT